MKLLSLHHNTLFNTLIRRSTTSIFMLHTKCGTYFVHHDKYNLVHHDIVRYSYGMSPHKISRKSHMHHHLQQAPQKVTLIVKTIICIKYG